MSKRKNMGAVDIVRDDDGVIHIEPSGSGDAPCSHDRFKDWSTEDFDREKKRIDRQLRHLEDVIPKIKKAQQRQKMKAFDPTI